MFDSINDTLYGENIQQIFSLSNQNETESEESDFEWCQGEIAGLEVTNKFTQFTHDFLRSENWSGLSDECPVQAEIRKPPDKLPAFQALHWQPGHQGVDMRPHVFDKVLNKWCLVDSGSMCTAFPPESSDKPVPGSYLRAVNGSRIQCYGRRKVEM